MSEADGVYSVARIPPDIHGRITANRAQSDLHVVKVVWCDEEGRRCTRYLAEVYLEQDAIAIAAALNGAKKQ